MGKKSKKLHKPENEQLQLINVGQPELQDGLKLDKSKKQISILNTERNTCIESENTNLVTKSKKKNRTRDINVASLEDTHAQIKSEAVIEDPADSNTTEIKKKKRKNRPELNDQGLGEDTQSENHINKINDDVPSPIKKKKKKSKLSEEDKQETEQEHAEIEDHKPHKDSKKNKNKSNLLLGHNAVEEIPKTENEQVKQKKKNRNKAKTGTPVLNNEEAQVTEEDIDRFCDELDEEDNKQYEDWVKLLDARLSKKLSEKK